MTEPARHHASGQAGFSLLEVLVAVAILSLLSLASLRLAGAGVDTARHLEGKTLALIVAENALVDVLLDPVTPRGRSSATVRNAERQWTVTQTISAMPDERVLKVDIQVLGASGEAAASLSGFKVVDGNV